MNCLNCGNSINPDDKFCQVCGARIPKHNLTSDPINANHNVEHSETMHDRHLQKKGNKNAIIIITALIVALSAVGSVLYFGLAHKDEETLWSTCELSRDLSDVRKYLEEYPNGDHHLQAQQLYDYLIGEKTEWEQAQSSHNIDYLRAFIKKYPSGKYFSQARDLLDDELWNSSIELNTKDAFYAYINEFPTGKHISEARNRFDEMRRAELTINERNEVKHTVERFLSGLESWQVHEMLSTCNTEMDSFMGKSNANQYDVIEYFNAYRESDIDSIHFNSLAVDVKKSMTEDNLPQYDVVFTVTRNFTRKDIEKGTIALMKGHAKLDAYYRFNELTLDKMP